MYLKQPGRIGFVRVRGMNVPPKFPTYTCISKRSKTINIDKFNPALLN
ncbi:hypothetical protein [Candidatus Enterovibrio escicola]|nr:hypothetical protein [Candidatus Enterovibrio escacola]